MTEGVTDGFVSFPALTIEPGLVAAGRMVGPWWWEHLLSLIAKERGELVDEGAEVQVGLIQLVGEVGKALLQFF